MYHVFVVNDVTFKYHLEYLFAGTCALQNPDFLEDSEYHNPSNKNDGVTPKQELSICGMIADVSRIRPGDKVIFYLTQTAEHEGMFFGFFTYFLVQILPKKQSILSLHPHHNSL